MKNVRSITKILEEINGGDKIQLGFSEIIERSDCGENIDGINERLKTYFHSKGFLL